MEPQKSNIAKLKELEVGDRLAWPIEKIMSVRSMCCNYGKALSRKYVTWTDNTNIYVERVK